MLNSSANKPIISFISKPRFKQYTDPSSNTYYHAGRSAATDHTKFNYFMSSIDTLFIDESKEDNNNHSTFHLSSPNKRWNDRSQKYQAYLAKTANKVHTGHYSIHPITAKPLRIVLKTLDYGRIDPMVDTGANLNAVSDQCVQQFKHLIKSDARSSYCATASGEIPLREFIELYIKIDNQYIPQKFYVVNGLPYDFLVGRPLLHRLHFVLSTDDGTFHHKPNDDHCVVDDEFFAKLEYPLYTRQELQRQISEIGKDWQHTDDDEEICNDEEKPQNYIARKRKPKVAATKNALRATTLHELEFPSMENGCDKANKRRVFACDIQGDIDRGTIDGYNKFGQLHMLQTKDTEQITVAVHRGKQKQALVFKPLTDELFRQMADDIEGSFGRRSKLFDAFMEYRDIFARNETDCGIIEGHDFPIELIPNAKPSKQRAYKGTEKSRKIIRDHVKSLLKAGFIRHCTEGSEWATPVCVVAKKQLDEWRVIMDVRGLNDNCVTLSYPIPNLNDLLRKFGKKKYFSSLDLRHGYHHIRIRPGDEHKTAFITEDGLFVWQRMSFGYKNAPAHFQAVMQKILKDIPDVMVYIDDVIIATESAERHYEILIEVFKRLRQYNLRLRADKCAFFRTKLEYLGHVVDSVGISANPEYIASGWRNLFQCWVIIYHRSHH